MRWTAAFASRTPVAGPPAGFTTKWIVPQGSQRKGVPSLWVLKKRNAPAVKVGEAAGTRGEMPAVTGAGVAETAAIAVAPRRTNTADSARKTARRDGSGEVGGSGSSGRSAMGIKL
jgi:hypothetical protein